MTDRVIEVVASLVRGHKSDGRCVYDAQAKRELVKRCQQPGVSVAATAMAHGINANLLRTWILKSSRRNGLAASIAPVMLPVKTRTESPVRPSPDGHLELTLPVGTIRIHGTVSRESLQAAIDCLLRRT